MRRGAAITVLICAVSLATAGPAGASSLTGGGTVSYQAASGEANNLTVSQAAGLLTFSDPGATIVPVAPCASVNANTATCPADGVGNLFADLGDLNDQARIDASVILSGFGPNLLNGGTGQDTLSAGQNNAWILFGGDQEDVLNGGAFAGTLSGAQGNDVLNGGSAGESLDGGDGNDVISGNGGNDFTQEGGAPNGADLINGGGGRDEVFYARSAGVNVSLDGAANDGEGCPAPACEGDDVGGDVEIVQTGRGNDVITGSAGDNILAGGDGNDLIDGGSGEDVVAGDAGADNLSGGAGDDSLGAGSGADSMSGGPGDDTLADAFQDENPDAYSGGPGTDTANFGNSILKLKVTLDGRPGDGIVSPAFLPSTDNVKADVENVLGGSGADILIGSKHSNQLEGGDGNDQLLGGAGADGLLGENGNDSLIGGNGRDLLDGAAGADRIASRDRRPDEVDCGSSADRVKADRVDHTSADCERVRRA
jgi:Ca2+-binding RTX toxin-like protein